MEPFYAALELAQGAFTKVWGEKGDVYGEGFGAGALQGLAVGLIALELAGEYEPPAVKNED